MVHQSFHPIVSAGHLEVICGPMFSGKTEELIRRLRRTQIARQHVLIFKPAIDDRYAKDDIVSHSSQQLPSIPVTQSHEILATVEASDRRVEVVGIDEVQFFDDAILNVCNQLANQGIRVVVAGLDLDYLGRPFGIMPQLLAIAESVTKVLAICMACGASASRSQRVTVNLAEGDSGQQVCVGAAEKYEARCRQCFVPELDTPSTIPEAVV